MRWPAATGSTPSTTCGRFTLSPSHPTLEPLTPPLLTIHAHAVATQTNLMATHADRQHAEAAPPPPQPVMEVAWNPFKKRKPPPPPPPPPPPQWRVVAGNLAAGAIAGCVVEAALYPLDTIKTRLQAMRSGGGIRALIKSGGGKALYAGVGCASPSFCP